jgi:CO dehydrogenase maturation factor
MKLMICGKGGSGKSTITALLARQYATEGKRVVVLDTDVSNRGLHRILGTSAPPEFTGKFGDKRALMEAFRKSHQEGVPRGTPLMGTWTYDTLPEAWCAANNGVKLVSVGKIQDGTERGKGRWVMLTRQFLGGLILSDKDRVIIDTDAGVEHLARGMGGFCDAILIVVDTSYESILMAQTVSRMMGPLNKPLFFILNKTNADTSRILRKTLPGTCRIIGEFPQDQDLFKAGFDGRELPCGSLTAAVVIEQVEGIHAG